MDLTRRVLADTFDEVRSKAFPELGHLDISVRLLPSRKRSGATGQVVMELHPKAREAKITVNPVRIKSLAELRHVLLHELAHVKFNPQLNPLCHWKVSGDLDELFADLYTIRVAEECGIKAKPPFSPKTFEKLVGAYARLLKDWVKSPLPIEFETEYRGAQSANIIREAAGKGDAADLRTALSLDSFRDRESRAEYRMLKEIRRAHKLFNKAEAEGRTRVYDDGRDRIKYALVKASELPGKIPKKDFVISFRGRDGFQAFLIKDRVPKELQDYVALYSQLRRTLGGRRRSFDRRKTIKTVADRILDKELAKKFRQFMEKKSG